jgi:O-antigen ligase
VWRGTAALALLPIALPLGGFFEVETAVWPRALVAGLALVAACSPASALLVGAALLPLAPPLGSLLGVTTTLAFAEVLTFACLAGWTVRFGIEGARPSRAARAAILPALVLGVVVAASVFVQSNVAPLSLDAPGLFIRTAWRFLSTNYCGPRAAFAAVGPGMAVLAGLGLFAAAVLLTARDAGLATRVAAMAAWGAFGVAAVNLQRLVTVSLRTGEFWTAIRRFVSTVRFTAAFPDVNAAGSYLAMGLVVTLGLTVQAWEGRRLVRGAAWGLMAIATGAALLLTGSRAALIAVVPALLVLLFASRLSKRFVRVAVLVVLVVAAAVLPVLSSRFIPADRAVSYRLETTRAALKMVSDHPVFGLGQGAFYDASARYFSAGFRQSVPRENAHNYFLQVLAELGIVGFAPFVWMIGRVGLRTLQAIRRGCVPMASAGAAAGLLAFCITWLSGHPMLVFEPATAFWIALGATGGAFAASPANEDERPWERHAAAAIVVFVMASVPFR